MPAGSEDGGEATFTQLQILLQFLRSAVETLCLHWPVPEWPQEMSGMLFHRRHC